MGLVETLDVAELEARLRRRVARGEVSRCYAEGFLLEVERAAASLIADREASLVGGVSVRGGRA